MSKFIRKENSLLGEVYYHAVHESGLAIYVIPKEFSTCYATLTAKYGSIDNKFRFEGEDEYTEVPNGIAHFLEHKMFENEDGTDAFLRYGATGAEANAFTSFIKTSYLFSCTERFNESLEILLETVYKPYFTPETVAKEQGIIGEEIGMMNDNPGWVLMFNMLSGMYRDHSVKINIAGSAQSISEITADTLYKCYNIFYQPSNMVLIACGKVEPDEVLAAVDRIVPKTPARPFESVYAEEEDRVVNGYVEAKMDVARPIFSIGIKDTDISPAPEGRLKKSAMLSVILETMFGPSSPIYNELYEQGLITGTLSCDYEHNRAFSFLEVSGECEEYDTVIATIIEYIDTVKK
ncbi:MAG: insulinase family protein, partial [Clostridia bacterium]|nr:insulinase family protein [Clostridia bacterium]